eukprot:gb/GEZJ01001175.1/.p1 GENE.gb/GEZJ01001175.1/~~gb/GEZJ01001175.1/.p1  ORF type:complete len:1409 (+),score=248.14 gb/GEZJ01001175.1/:47-4228(+)
MTSPFEVTLASLNRAAAQCESEQQRFFQRVQHDAHVLVADLLRSANAVIAVIADAHIKVRRCEAAARTRRRRAPRGAVSKRRRALVKRDATSTSRGGRAPHRAALDDISNELAPRAAVVRRSSRTIGLNQTSPAVSSPSRTLDATKRHDASSTNTQIITVFPELAPSSTRSVPHRLHDDPAADATAFATTASDALASDAPASDAPASDAPISDAPVSDAPASEAPASVSRPSDARTSATTAPHSLPHATRSSPPLHGTQQVSRSVPHPERIASDASSHSLEHCSAPQQAIQSGQHKLPVGSRRSSATVESYETANADLEDMQQFSDGVPYLAPSSPSPCNRESQTPKDGLTCSSEKKLEQKSIGNEEDSHADISGPNATARDEPLPLRDLHEVPTETQHMPFETAPVSKHLAQLQPQPPIVEDKDAQPSPSVPLNSHSHDSRCDIATAFSAHDNDAVDVRHHEKPPFRSAEDHEQVDIGCHEHEGDPDFLSRKEFTAQQQNVSNDGLSEFRENDVSDIKSSKRPDEAVHVKLPLQHVRDSLDCRSSASAEETALTDHRLQTEEAQRRPQVRDSDDDLESVPDLSGEDLVKERLEPSNETSPLFQEKNEDNSESEEKHSSSRNRTRDNSVSQASQGREDQRDESSPTCQVAEPSERRSSKEIDSNGAEVVTETEAVSRKLAWNTTKNSARDSPEAKSSQGPDSDTDALLSMPPPRNVPTTRTSRKQSRIVVDNAGKIDHNSLGLLSKIITTKAADEIGTHNKEPLQKISTPRTTKLFNPQNNIYSLQQTGAERSVQRFSSSNRTSVLSHTPGAEAPCQKPSPGLSRQERLASPGLSRQERLASLNKQLEVIQTSKSPALKVAQLRLARTGAQHLSDYPKPKDSHLGFESDNIFRSVRDRTLKIHETNVKEVSKVGILSMRENYAKTSPRENLRARERSKSKSAYRSKLAEIMTGKSVKEHEGHGTFNTYNSISSRFLDNKKADASEAEQMTYGNEEKKLLKTLTKDRFEPKVSPLCTDITAAQSDTQQSTAEKHSSSHDREKGVSRELDCSDGNNAFSSKADGEVESSLVARDSTAASHVDITRAPNAPLSNLMSSIVSFLPGSSSLLGTRPTKEQSEESEAEAAAKRQKLDMERREAEVQARREAQRLLKQKETEEKQRRAEKRRLLLAEAEKEKEEERRRKEERRMKKKLEEEEQRKKKRQDDDRKKEERRRLVLEKKARNEIKLKRKKNVNETFPARKVPKGISGKAWFAGQGVVHTPDIELSGCEKPKQRGAPSTPITKKIDASHGPANYDMTPAQETRFELSDEEEERRKHKEIPLWAQGPKLSVAARAQPDPDDVFVNVPTCDLREVFGNVRRFRARTSSANWARDRVTAQEMVKFRKSQAAFHETTK